MENCDPNTKMDFHAFKRTMISAGIPVPSNFTEVNVGYHFFDPKTQEVFQDLAQKIQSKSRSSVVNEMVILILDVFSKFNPTPISLWDLKSYLDTCIYLRCR